jgi:hypothetical protein
MKPLILGEAPGRSRDPFWQAAPAGRFTGRLFEWSSLTPDAFDCANLLDSYPGPEGRGAAFPTGAAEEARQRLLPALQGRVVVLLGTRLARLFGTGGRYVFYDLGGVWVSWVYHPSGLTLQYNDPAERAAAGATLRRAVELAR